MFVDEHLAEWCLVCCWFFGVLAHGSRLTRRTTDGDFCFLPCWVATECFWVALFPLLLLWLRIPVMGAGNLFCFVAHGGWDPGIEKTTKSAHLIFGVFEQN
jgi:hypothetical protein